MKIKLNVPLSDADHEAADIEHKQRAESNIKFLNEIANHLEAGNPLSSLQRKFAAGALRSVAKNMKTERPRPAGKPAKLPGDLAVLFAIMVHLKGMSQNRAIEQLAEQYDVSTTAVKKRLGKAGPVVEKKAARQALAEAEAFVRGI